MSRPNSPVSSRYGAPMGRYTGNSQYLRARDRDDAKAKILADWPDARFFR